MKMTGNTILITGGGSGIGRRLAESFFALGNQVVIAGRRQSVLDEVTAANPGMKAAPLDIEDPAAIQRLAALMRQEHPALNVVIHNAGIMRIERLQEVDGKRTDAEATLATNLYGPIRLTDALLPQLLQQDRATIMTVSSGLAFVPLAITPTYSATKAAIHSYSLSLRQQLQGTGVEVVELIPPYVATDLQPGQASDPRAMPLDEFITEVMELLTTQPEATEIVVGRCKPLRFAAETGTFDKMFGVVNAAH